MRATWLCSLGALLLAGAPLAARAQVYRCTGSGGSVAFQDHPCAEDQRQTIVNVPSRGPPGYVPPAPATTMPPSSTDLLPPPRHVPPPAAPLPVLYACVGAVNGKHYLARRPPPSYLAPLGVMGYPPRSLVQAYGRAGGAGMSAPEAAPKPPLGGPPVAGMLTRVRDYCVPATQVQACAFVAREYAANQHQLNLAMQHEQPPLQRRAEKLDAQLRNCR